MSRPDSKQRDEQATFARFIQRLDSHNEWAGISSRPEPEPHLLCIHLTEGPIAFQLLSLTDPTIAEIQAAPEALDHLIQNTFNKAYDTDALHIELLLHTGNRITTPDDAIIPILTPLFESMPHPYKRVWFMGEQTTCNLWQTNQVS